MTESVRNLALVVHDSRPEARQLAKVVAAAAAQRDLGTVEWEPGVDLDAVDVVMGIGGDGTLLSAAGLAVAGTLPVVGINLGTVGYLADSEPESLEPLLDGLVAGTLVETRRMTVAVDAGDGRVWHGINDVVLDKVVSRRLVQIEVEISGHYFTSYRADAIIVATPLGSTAYSLAAGGPVLDPALEALILTPVAPHSLLSRSIVLAPTAEVRCTVALDRSVRINVDGRDTIQLEHGDAVTIRRGATDVRFLSLGSHPFPQAVRHQFGLDHA